MKVCTFLILSMCLFNVFNSLNLKHHVHGKRKERKLMLQNPGVDDEQIDQQNESDNPLSQLWDANHMKVAQQKVNMNLNIPINRLKLHVSGEYKVKIILHDDRDYAALKNYFFPEETK